MKATARNNFHVSPGPDCSDLPSAIAWQTAGLRPPSELSPPSEAADARMFLTSPSSAPLAHAALWWRDVPRSDLGQLGVIGGFDATDQAHAIEILHHAIAHLRFQGATTIVGPMNGNTWRRYRLVTGSDGSRPFALEPQNPVDFPKWWEAAGFTELSRYSSSQLALEGTGGVSPRVAARLEASGLEIHPFDPAAAEAELRAIHAISEVAFRNAYLYSPLVPDDFLAAYLPLVPRLVPEFILIARINGQPCGFIFALPDFSATPDDTPALVVKTLAVDPALAPPGLGSLLIDRVQIAAFEAGFRDAIHALQHESNSSLRITRRHSGKVIRRYSLYKFASAAPPRQ